MSLQFKGDGSIVGLVPGGLPAGSVQQLNLAAGTGGNGPAFSAWQSVAHSLGNGAATRVQFQTKEFDTASAFDATTNFRFQPLVPGYYQLTGGVYVNVTCGGYVCLLKNAAAEKRGTQVQANGQLFTVTGLIYLNGSTDYVELHCYQLSGAAQNSYPGQNLSYFEGFLARAA